MLPLVISYYTRNTGYANEVEELRRSTEKYGLRYFIRGIETLGSWQKNTQYKPTFVLDMLQEHKCPVLLVDADAVFKGVPEELIDFKEDIALHEVDWLKYRAFDDRREMLSGTMAFNPNSNTFRFINEWIQEVNSNPNEWEQKCMERVAKRLQSEGLLSVKYLPPTYCKIFDLMSTVDNPIIEHYQASRKYKVKVGL